MLSFIRKHPLLKQCLFFLPAIAGAVLLWFSTREAVGITPDSVEYLYAAETFSKGEGLLSVHGSVHQQAYLSHFPPGISALYGTVAAITGAEDMSQVARWMNIVFFSLTALLITLLVKRRTGNEVAAFFASVFFVSQIQLFNIHRMAWSEPLFMLLALLCLYFMHLWMDTELRRYLIAAAVMAGMACIVRYIGITLILTCGTIVLFRRGMPLRQRFSSAFLFGIPAMLPLIFAVIRNMNLSQTATDRHLSFHPMTIEYLQDFLQTLNGFFMAFNNGKFAFTGGIILLLLVPLLLFFTRSMRHGDSFARLLIIYPVVYLLFLAVSNTFFDFTPLYYRIVSPVLLLVFLVLVIGFGNGSFRGNRYWIALPVILLLLQINNFRIVFMSTPDSYTTNPDWKNSETIRSFASLPPGSLVYTSEPDGVYAVSRMRVNHQRCFLADTTANRGKKVYLVYFKTGRPCEGASFEKPFAGNFAGLKIISQKEYPDGKVFEVDTHY